MARPHSLPEAELHHAGQSRKSVAPQDARPLWRIVDRVLLSKSDKGTASQLEGVVSTASSSYRAWAAKPASSSTNAPHPADFLPGTGAPHECISHNFPRRPARPGGRRRPSAAPILGDFPAAAEADDGRGPPRRDLGSGAPSRRPSAALSVPDHPPDLTDLTQVPLPRRASSSDVDEPSS